jgi:DNA replicative helicase MCM subunit Mcm2 (Cdc46/Mcm family)
LAKDIISHNFTGLSLVGGNSTRSGLVCNLTTGELGVLAYSDQKLVLVDEFDKIPKEDIEYCSELLSNGKANVHSAKVHADIVSRFIMIAFANPKSKIFSDIPLKDIGLSPILMSRFGLVVKTESLEKDDRMELFKKKFYGETEIKKVPELYDQWVKLARLHEPKIKISDGKIKKYLDNADQFFQKYEKTALRRDLRMGDYVKRIPMAIARAEFSDVTDKTLELAEQILTDSLKDWD